jgi:hypothetical protein
VKTSSLISAWLRPLAWVAFALGILLPVAPLHAAEDIPVELLKGLESKSPKVRIYAVSTLARIDDKRVRIILEGMLEDKAATVRAAALEGLERHGDPEAIPAVTKRKKDESRLVRKVARRVTKQLAKIKRRAGEDPKNKSGKSASTTTLAKASGGDQGPIPKGSVPVDLSKVADDSDGSIPGLADELRKEITKAVKGDGRRKLYVSYDRLKKGLALNARIRKVRVVPHGTDSMVEITCGMTIAQLPGNILRLSSNATVGVALAGTLTEKEKKSLADSGVQACAGALAKDFTDYVVERVR